MNRRIQKKAMNTIFISHSSKDKAIADKLHTLLSVGVGIHSDDVFCTSLGGLGVPVGKDDTETIRAKLSDCTAAVALVSAKFLDSWFCHYELGALWLMKKPVYVMLLPPLTVAKVKAENRINAIIGNWQMMRIDDSAAWDDARDGLVQQLGIRGVRTAVWQAQKTAFTSSIRRLCSSLIPPPRGTCSPEPPPPAYPPPAPRPW
jgi:hypothetical protein